MSDNLTTLSALNYFHPFSEIEEQVRNIQAKRQGLSLHEDEHVGLGSAGHFDQEIYGHGSYDNSRFVGYDTSIAVTDEPDVSVEAYIKM